MDERAAKSQCRDLNCDVSELFSESDLNWLTLRYLNPQTPATSLYKHTHEPKVPDIVAGGFKSFKCGSEQYKSCVVLEPGDCDVSPY